jgi:hypothetical protein
MTDKVKLDAVRNLNHDIESELYKADLELSNLLGEYTGLFGNTQPIVRILSHISDLLQRAKDRRAEQCRVIIELQATHTE